jgi:hypothetical protein
MESKEAALTLREVSIIVMILSGMIILLSIAFLLTVMGLIIGAVSLHGASQLMRRRIPDPPSDPAQHGLFYEEMG